MAGNNDRPRPEVYVVSFRIRVLGHGPADAELRVLDALEDAGAVTFRPREHPGDVRLATPEERALHLAANGWDAVPDWIPEWQLVSGDGEGPALDLDLEGEV